MGLIIVAASTASMIGAGCDSSSSPGGTGGGGGGSTGTGGATATGGTTGTGGTTATGGTTGTGGTTATGGTTGTGGTTATGGATGTGGATATGGAGGATGGSGGSGPPYPWLDVTIPTAITVPTGNVRKFRAHAVGVQTYTCTATVAAADGGVDAGATTYAWSAGVPTADLSDENGTKIGMHYVGPTWMSTDGSDVVGMKVASDPGPDTTAIPWLLLKAVSHMGAGVMADITYVQRVNTKKGVAPAASACDAAHVNTATPVDYTADYYFYKSSDADAGVTADWPITSITIPSALALTGPTLKLQLHAIGSQIYTCTGTTTAGADGGAGTTTYAWVLKQPDAKLYDTTNTQVATHGLGPNWTSIKDGSVVNGTKIAAVDSPLSDAIQWLLLKASSHTGTGVFSDVTYVQRVNTTKGKAPATGCDAAHANTDTSSAYTADYYFYTGDVPATDGGTD
ncbi:MAG TPA: DUF3455 domain-containing protein [Polyangia bacterium]|nr:DUF3455 domain-containing protein [Polyangia bacterium]